MLCTRTLGCFYFGVVLKDVLGIALEAGQLIAFAFVLVFRFVDLWKVC